MLSNPQTMPTPMIYPIVRYSAGPRSILKQRSSDITQEDFGGIEVLAAAMLATMYNANGVGLAAPQIGIGKRIAVIDISEDRSSPIVLINPQIRFESDNQQAGIEGCLSLPGFRAGVERPEMVQVWAEDVHGKEFNFQAEGLLARACCHEIGHLNGELFIDHISGLKRNLIRQKIMKLKRKGRW